MAPAAQRVLSAAARGLLLAGFLIHQCAAGVPAGFVQYTQPGGQTVLLQDDRQPALYTGDFGDCLGGSLLEITRFDAEYWVDNMTVGFHLAGPPPTVDNINTVMSLSVYAYGQSRFNLLFNPCGTSIQGLCPTNTSISIEAAGIIPVSDNNVADIPSLAFSIPDFEGQAILRVFSNNTQSEIACFSAVVSNGNSLSHPQIIAPTIGFFVIAALVASFASAIYGDSIPTIRTHYAHSMSVWVVFSCLHHVFYTGALSVNWPTVLPAFWSNFAPFAGMIYSPAIVSSINSFIGFDVGNTSLVGASPQGSQSDGVGGGYDISSIFKRGENLAYGRKPALLSEYREQLGVAEAVGQSLGKRALPDADTGFQWYGAPVEGGLPLPGNYSGFAGALYPEGIPPTQALMTGLVWFSVMLGGMIALVVIFKTLLEVGSRFGLVRRDTLPLFRQYWVAVAAMVAARTFFIGFFMIVYLCLFQFVYKGPIGVTVVAAVVLVIFVLGLGGLCFLTCFYRLRFGRFTMSPDKLHIEPRRLWFGFSRESTRKAQGRRMMRASKSLGMLPFFRIDIEEHSPEQLGVHEDVDFLKRYGWLTARFRRTRWSFFVVWLIYETTRALFFGVAAGHPQTQVWGLLAVEIVSFLAIWLLKPFEGNRLNVITVYLLGFSKVACVALASAFDPRFNLDRITAAAIGFVIIVIQGLLIVAMLILIVLGAMSTRMSLTRDREVGFGSEDWGKLRARYFTHIDRLAHEGLNLDSEAAAPVTAPKEPASKEFRVSSIRRVPKIEDADDPEAADYDPYGSRLSVVEGAASALPSAGTRRASRANSMHSNLSHSNLPFGARPHRQSWSSREFQSFAEAQRPRSRVSSGVASPVGNMTPIGIATPMASPVGGEWTMSHTITGADSITVEHFSRPNSFRRQSRRVSTRSESGPVPKLPPVPLEARRSRRSTYTGSERVANIDERAIEESEQQDGSEGSERGSESTLNARPDDNSESPEPVQKTV